MRNVLFFVAIGIMILIGVFVFGNVIFGGDSSPFFIKDASENINAVCVNTWEKWSFKIAKHCWEISRQLF